MPGNIFIVSKNAHAKDPSVSFHRFSPDPGQQDKWLSVFELDKSEVKFYFRVQYVVDTFLEETQN